jgi:hypothetical protein
VGEAVHDDVDARRGHGRARPLVLQLRV